MKRQYFISLLLAVIALAIGIFSYLEYARTKKDLDTMIKSEAFNLVQALKYSIENNVKSNEYIQKEMLNSLVTASSLADHLNEHKEFSEISIKDFATEYDIDIIIVIDQKGMISNVSNLNIDDLPIELTDDFKLLKDEKYFWLELGRHEIKSELYYLIGGLYSNDNSLIISGIRDEKLLDLRQSVGIGVLINNFSRNNDIEYVALQDSLGVIAATKNFGKIKTIAADSNLSQAGSEPIARESMYNGRPVMESIIKIDTEDADMYLQLGLSLDKVSEIEQRTGRRTILLAFGLFLIVAGSAAFIYLRGSHIKLLETHKKNIEQTGILLSNINDAVVGIDNNFNILIFNNKAEEFFGKRTLGKYDEVFPDDQLKLKESITEISSIGYEEIEHNSNNTDLILALSTSIVFDKSGGVDIAIAIVRDITELKQAEQTTLRNEKLTATSELAAGVAHEIRNPMNAINVIAQRLEIEFEPTEDREEYNSLVATVRREIKRIDKIISQFIEFSKMKPSVPILNNLSTIVQKAVELQKPLANAQRIEIINKLPAELEALLDFDKIEQVIINLIQNAIDSIGTDGEITISAISDELSVSLFIADTGKGIADDIKHKVFDLYFTTKNKGMGLGLGIVNKIILEHNGKISFNSSEGMGTVFNIEFRKVI